MFLHLTVFWAIALASCQVTPTFSRSCRVERLQLIFGLPYIYIYIYCHSLVHTPFNNLYSNHNCKVLDKVIVQTFKIMPYWTENQCNDLRSGTE